MNLDVLDCGVRNTGTKGNSRMSPFTIRVVESGSRKFVEGMDGGASLQTENDVLELIGVCGENDTDRIMLHEGMFPESFFDLKSGKAGMILQKFVNYQIRVAALISPSLIRGKFGEFVTETNHGNHFRIFHDRDKAEHWLLGD
jgi:hypothetical protein